MNPTVNMIIVLEKELALEHQGFRRTRRYIGDARQVADDRWYRASGSRVADTRHTLDAVNQVVRTKPSREARRSILARLFHLPRTRRQAACNECS